MNKLFILKRSISTELAVYSLLNIILYPLSDKILSYFLSFLKKLFSQISSSYNKLFVCKDSRNFK